MGFSGGSSPAALAETRQVFERLAAPGTPLATGEVAEALDCTRRSAAQALEALVDEGVLQHKRFGTGTCVWWRPATAPTADEKSTSASEESTSASEESTSASEETTSTNADSKASPERDADAQQAQLEAFVDAVEEYAIFLLDPGGHVRTWNRGAELLKGYEKSEIVGEHFSAFYPDEAVAEGVPEQNLQRARENGQFEEEGERVRKDGDTFWARVTITAFRDDDGELRGFAKVTRDMTERHEYEQRLQREKERFQRLVDDVQDYAIFMLDPEGHIETWNRGAERIKGYTQSEAVGEHVSLFYPEDESDRPEQLLAEAAAQGRVATEGWRLRKDGSRFWASVVITAIYDDGELRGFAKVTRDLTARKRRERRLAALAEIGRGLLAAESPADVCDVVVEATVDGLDLPISAIALYDEDSGSLEPVAQTARAVELQAAVPFLDPATEVPWEGFGHSEPVVVDDVDVATDQSPSEHPVTSGVVVPLGKHGVFVTAFTSPGGPTDEELDFATVVASDLEAALNHAERQQFLRERETTLEAQNESLERLNRINDVIRTITQGLVDATSREEIEQVACNELGTGGPYRFAWIGGQDPATEAITPEAWAGVEPDYLDDLAIDAAGELNDAHPALVAAQRRESIAIGDVRSDPPFEPWRKEALKRGYRSIIAVPLTYGDSLYGTLTVLSEDAATFNGMERRVIEELGEIVAHAINALESKQALVSDEILELELQVTDPEIPILQLVERADCTCELDNVLSREDGTLGVFFTTQGATVAAVEAFVEDSLAFSDLRVIDEDDDECVFEATASESTLVATLLDHGAAPRTITAADGRGRVVVELPSQANVREFVEMLQAKHPGSELSARRTHERTARTPHEFKAAFEGRLTDRQREVLQTAYFGGFFDTPRRSTGQEIGDALGVSQPTVNHHLRACQRELLEMLYEDVRPTV